jgi:hypothetical protein
MVTPVNAQAGGWCLAAGSLVALRGALEFANPAYYDPTTLFDYSAAVLSSLAWLVLAVALALWWRARPIGVVSFLLLLAAAGLAVSSAGNFLEDVLDVAVGDALFTYGGMVGAGSMLATGLALIPANESRWPALFVLGFVAGSTFPDNGGEILSGASLLALGYWLRRQGP